MANTIKVGLFLAGMTALFVVLGQLVAGPMGALVALAIAVALNLATFWYSDRYVLSMTGAHPLTPEEAPELHQMLERTSQAAGIPTPRLYLIDDPQPNAFATGRGPSSAAVAVNQGLLDLLDRDEVEGVIAHEVAHIKNRDTLIMTVAAMISGAIMALVNIGQIGLLFGLGGSEEDEEQGGNPISMLLMLFLAPVAATLIQLAISRAREFEADATAARLTGSPEGLMGALRKLEHGAQMIPGSVAPAAAHLCIVNPLAGVGSSLAGLFQTHPPIERRVEALARLSRDHALTA
jgi:heat shock protein HtpX